MSPSRPNGVVNFFVVNAYRVVSEFVVISGKLFREHWSTFSLTFTAVSLSFEMLDSASFFTLKVLPLLALRKFFDIILAVHSDCPPLVNGGVRILFYHAGKSLWIFLSSVQLHYAINRFFMKS